jgi:magnesium transporter
MSPHFDHAPSVPGAAPGIEHHEIAALPGSSGPVRIGCLDYSPGQVAMQSIEDLDGFVAHHRPDWSVVRWISVDGLSDMRVIHALATKYDLHPLAVEDMLHGAHRPKIETYGGEGGEYAARVFVVTQALRLEDGRLQHAQVSIFLGHTTVITFHEGRSDLWDPIRQRIQTKGSRLRNNDASFLAYSLLDAVVDGCFPILETYGDRAEDLEARILARSHPGLINEVHQLKRDLLKLRWVMWPMREVASSLLRDSHECVSDTTRLYLRDLYDHIVQIIELVETYREIATDLTETYMTSVSNRMNEIMKVLTLIGTIFIPLTFLAGVYGMNMRNIPELELPWAYPAFWLVCLAVVGGMLVFFRRRRWL